MNPLTAIRLLGYPPHMPRIEYIQENIYRVYECFNVELEHAKAEIKTLLGFILRVPKFFVFCFLNNY